MYDVSTKFRQTPVLTGVKWSWGPFMFHSNDFYLLHIMINFGLTLKRRLGLINLTLI